MSSEFRRSTALLVAGALVGGGCATTETYSGEQAVVYTLTGDCEPGKKGRATLPPFSYDKAGGQDYYIRAGENGAEVKVKADSRKLELEGVNSIPPSEVINLHGEGKVIFELKPEKKNIKTTAVCE